MKSSTSATVARNNNIWAILFIVAAVFMVVTAVILNRNSKSGRDEFGSKSPLGGLLDKAFSVSELKSRMGDLREVHPAIMKFAEAHQDELPKTVAELKPFLPPKLTSLDDEHWELPTAGKMTPLMNGGNANTSVLIQQKNVPPGKPKIITCADGHIEYKP